MALQVLGYCYVAACFLSSAKQKSYRCNNTHQHATECEVELMSVACQISLPMVKGLLKSLNLKHHY